MEVEVQSVDVGLSHGSGVRTFLVFLDLPKHVEFRTDGFPLLAEGSEVSFDLTVRDPRGRKPWELKGPYRVKRRVLKFLTGRASRNGFSQYLELEPVEGALSS